MLWALGGADLAHACGPNLPLRLLDDRAEALLSVPEGTFLHEVDRLAPAPEGLVEALEGDRFAHEIEGLMQHASSIARMREAGSLEVAEQHGASLPPEVRLYTLGALAFRGNQPEVARDYFERVVDLPAEAQAHRGVWARYMLGRLASGEEAVAHFGEVRRQVQAGAADPEGLGRASLGEEARAELARGRFTHAVQRYAEQAALGHPGADLSLLFVARRMAQAASPAALARWVRHDATRRLLVIYAWTRPRELERRGLSAAALVAAIEEAGVKDVEHADHLAALAYGMGRYALAERAVGLAAPSGLSAWMRAKLALRQGDKAAAASAFREALAAFGEHELWALRRHSGTYETEPVSVRIRGELGVLQVAQGSYEDALRTLLDAADIPELDASSPRAADFDGYVETTFSTSFWGRAGWEDAAFVAERLLTVEELVQFVDHEPLPVAASLRLRSVLARRLMREASQTAVPDRATQAATYFDNPELAERARAYADALQRTVHGDAYDRAAAWLEAGAIVRPGIDLLGTEGEPDYVALKGWYERWDWEADTDATLVVPPDSRWCGPEESQRAASSAAHPDRRFHYRDVAADHAVAAADLLPSDSQPFAVALCQAATYARDRHPARYAALYARYVDEGPLYEGSGSFGAWCPEPDFVGLRWRPWRRWVAHNRPVLEGLALVGLGLFALVLAMRFRRGKAGVPS